MFSLGIMLESIIPQQGPGAKPRWNSSAPYQNSRYLLSPFRVLEKRHDAALVESRILEYTWTTLLAA